MLVQLQTLARVNRVQEQALRSHCERGFRSRCSSCSYNDLVVCGERLDIDAVQSEGLVACLSSLAPDKEEDCMGKNNAACKLRFIFGGVPHYRGALR